MIRKNVCVCYSSKTEKQNLKGSCRKFSINCLLQIMCLYFLRQDIPDHMNSVHMLRTRYGNTNNCQEQVSSIRFIKLCQQHAFRFYLKRIQF